jgi:mRNA interferase RelE/StbE
LTVEYSDEAKKQLKKLDKYVAGEIKSYMDGIKKLKDPRTRGRELTSNLSGLWRYRVGDYRLICEIKDEKMMILVLVIGHRKEIYR